MDDDFEYHLKLPSSPPAVCIIDNSSDEEQDTEDSGFLKKTADDLAEDRADDENEEWCGVDDRSPSSSSPLVKQRKGTAPKEPVVVLLGWLGCSNKNLSKYSEIYEAKGWVIFFLFFKNSFCYLLL